MVDLDEMLQKYRQHDSIDTSFIGKVIGAGVNVIGIGCRRIRFTRVKRETGVSPVRSRHCEKGVRSSRKIATDVRSIGKVVAG